MLSHHLSMSVPRISHNQVSLEVPDRVLVWVWVCLDQELVCLEGHQEVEVLHRATPQLGLLCHQVLHQVLPS